MPGINPNAFMHALVGASRAAAAYVVDVGQHQMWAAQSLAPAAGQRFLTSGGMGAMGFALPAAIGAALGVPSAGRGDRRRRRLPAQHPGAADRRRDRLPVKVVILDNGVHGMVRQFQESYFDGRFPSTRLGLLARRTSPRVAAAYGIDATTVTEAADLDAGAPGHLSATRGARTCSSSRSTPTANAYPKLAFGRPITEMEPLATPLPLQR